MNLISSQMSFSQPSLPKLETSQADRSFRVYSSPQTIQQFINNIYNSLRANGLGSDQARLSIGPDMGPNCLQKLSTDKGCRLQDSRTSSTFACPNVLISVSQTSPCFSTGRSEPSLSKLT